MELTGYIAILRRWWLTIVAATVIAALAGYVMAAQTQPVYESTARVLVGPVSSTDLDDLRVAGQLTQTYAELVSSETLLEAAIRDVPLAASVDQLRRSIRARGNTTTRILTITVQSNDPTQAAAAANGLAASLRDLTSGPVGPGTVQVVATAQPSSRPVAPQLPLMTALSGAVGFVGVVLLVLFADYWTNVVRDRRDLEGLLGLPVVATIALPDRPRMMAYWKFRGLEEMLASDPQALAYRRLGALTVVAAPMPVGSLLVAGTERDDRSAEVALGMAAALAASGRPITLLDADDQVRGLTRLLELRADGPGGRQPVTVFDGLLEVHPYHATPFSRQPRADMRSFAASIAQAGRMLVVSGGPLGSSPSAGGWAAQCDGTLVVAQRDTARRTAATEAANTLRLTGAHTVGSVLVEASEQSWRARLLRRRGPAAVDPQPELGRGHGGG